MRERPSDFREPFITDPKPDFSKMTERQSDLRAIAIAVSTALNDPLTPVSPEQLLTQAVKERLDSEEIAVIHGEINAFKLGYPTPSRPNHIG